MIRTVLSTIPLLALVLVLLGGCDTGTSGTCIDHGDCTGEREACIDDKCRQVECLESAHCSLHQYCATGGNFVCREGCRAEDDCMAGETCNTDQRVCESYGCRNSTLDCPIGYTCANSGDCTKDNRDHCKVCDPWEELLGLQPCGSSGSCWLFEEGATLGYCLISCNQNNPNCPAGYTCEDVTGAGEYACSAWCPWLEDNGYL